MKMGLNCVDSLTSLTPFDMEMRRRLWWQLSTLDIRIAEDYQVPPNILPALNTTSFPANTNDGALDPAMTSTPQSEPRRTEMLYNLTRFQGSHFLREVVFSDDVCVKQGYKIRTNAEKCAFIDEFWAKMENTLLCHCDPSVPIDNVTITSIRLILVKSKLTIMKPNPLQKQNAPTRESYRNTCKQVLEYAYELRQYEPGKKWLWLFQTYIEWDALAYLLLDLSLTAADDTDDLWETVKKTYQHWAGTSNARTDHRWVHITELHGKAVAAKTHLPSLPERRRTRQTIPPPSKDLQHTGHAPDQQPTAESNITINADALWSQILAPCPSTVTDQPLPVNAIDPSFIPSSGSMPDWDHLLFDRYWQAVG